MASETILVTGATGTMGGATVEALVKRGAAVRALVRDPEKAGRLRERGVTVVAGDLSDAASVLAALRGIRRVFLAIPGNPYQPDQLALARTFLEALRDSEVEHVVDLSMWGAGRSVHRPEVMRNHARIEDDLLATGRACTFLQSTFSMQALLGQGLGQTAAAEGRIYTPFGEAGFAFIDARDVGRAAAVCLTSDAHTGKTYELSGPEILRSSDLAATIGRVVGREVADVPITDEQAIGALQKMGLPAWFTEHMATLIAFNRTGALARLTPAIRDITGEAAGTFERFVTDHRAAFTMRVP